MFPHWLKENGFNCVAFREVTEPEEMFYDLRTPEERDADTQNKVRKSLNVRLEVIKQRPELISYSTMESEKQKWTPSVHDLRKQDCILKTTESVEHDGKIDFTFYHR